VHAVPSQLFQTFVLFFHLGYTGETFVLVSS
jgi:hypothetical protein